MPVIKSQNGEVVNPLEAEITDPRVTAYLDGSNNEFWALNTVTYGSIVNEVTSNAIGYYTDDDGNNVLPFAFEDSHLAQVDALLTGISGYIDLSFERVDEGVPLINFSFSSFPFGAGAAGFPQYEINFIGGSEVGFGNTVQIFYEPLSVQPAFDDSYYEVVMHEIGHALGLAHPINFGDTLELRLPADVSGSDFTIMSSGYIETFSSRFEGYYLQQEITSWLLSDIVALQAIYGVDQTVTVGNDTYTFYEGTSYYEVLWDTSGVDTIVIEGNSAATIDLSKEGWIDVGSTAKYARFDNPESFMLVHETVYLMDGVVIEKLIGGGGADIFLGNDTDNFLAGNAGNDKLFGGSGGDALVGGADNDTLRGDAGDDVSSGGAGDDQLFAGPGDDGDDIAIGGAGNDVLGGAAGDDLIVGGGYSDGPGLQLNLGNEGDTSADDGSDVLFGGDGNDTLIGGGWNDALTSDNGSYDAGEEITTGTGDDQLWAGGGDDLIIGAAGDDQIGGGVGDDTINSGGGDDVIYGGRDTGDTGTNDVIDAGSGDDMVFAGVGHDSVTGGTGDDLIFSGGGNDTVLGGSGNDDIFSGGGDDSVSAGEGDDTLWGGGGDDIFTGGAGADTFVFAAGQGDDSITDFDSAGDILRLSNTNTDFTSLADVEAAATEQNGGILIDLGGGDSLFLAGLGLNDLPSVSFVF